MAENPPRRERPEQEKERERKERMHTVAVATATDAKRHAPPEPPPPAKQEIAEVALERTPSGFRWKEIRGDNTYREQACTGKELAKLLRDLADEIDPASAAGK